MNPVTTASSRECCERYYPKNFGKSFDKRLRLYQLLLKLQAQKLNPWKRSKNSSKVSKSWYDGQLAMNDYTENSQFAVFSNAVGFSPCIPLRQKCLYSKFFWSAFSRIRTDYGEILRISPHSFRMWENTDQKNSEYRHFSRSVRWKPETYSEPSRTSKMELFTKIVNGFQPVNNWEHWS